MPSPSEPCTICLSSHLTKPTLVKPCRHIFCYVCILSWIEQKHLEHNADLTKITCPICRKCITSIKYREGDVDKVTEINGEFRRRDGRRGERRRRTTTDQVLGNAGFAFSGEFTEFTEFSDFSEFSEFSELSEGRGRGGGTENCLADVVGMRF